MTELWVIRSWCSVAFSPTCESFRDEQRSVISPYASRSTASQNHFTRINNYECQKNLHQMPRGKKSLSRSTKMPNAKNALFEAHGTNNAKVMGSTWTLECTARPFGASATKCMKCNEMNLFLEHVGPWGKSKKRDCHKNAVPNLNTTVRLTFVILQFG